MNKKKSIIISIIFVIVIIVLISSSTFAYISARTKEENIGTGSGMLDINYSITPENITGNLVSSINRESGLKAVATVSLKTGSEVALLNMYVTPTALTNLNISAFKWEVEGISGDEIVYTNENDFSTASENTPIKVVDGYALTEDDTIFTIYIWLDASLVNSPIENVSFGAKITADSSPLTGNF